MNIANQITILRVLISLLCMGLILRFSLASLILGFFLFLLASFTDFLDGYIARKKNKISDLGKLLDPLADKVLIIGVFLALLEKGLVNSFLVILIMIREFLITGLRLFALRQNKVIAAQSFGKHKTLTQMLAIIFIFILIITEKALPKLGISWGWFREFRKITVFLIMVWVAGITLISGGMYLWKNRKIIKSL